MKYAKFLTIFILPAIIFFGCAHTNELAKYNLTNKNILFKQCVNPALTRVTVDINTSYESNNPFVVILSDIGSLYSEGEIREKIQKAVNADSIVKSISEGLKDGLNTYYRINAVSSLDENPNYILETKLEKFRLSSNSYGIFATVECTALITDRNSAKTVWENTESNSIPLNDVIISYGETTLVRTTASVINAIRLMNMTDEEIRTAISYAVKEAGKNQSDQLREDIANKSN
jgi:hypothetical protein